MRWFGCRGGVLSFRLVLSLLVLLPPTSTQLSNHGLPSNGVRINGIAIGALPDWSHEGPIAINKALGQAVSVIGDYINISPSSYSLSQVEYHLPELLQVASGNVKAVYAPAILFSASLDQWSVDITNAIAAKCKELNRQGIVVWLRLLFEMNGGWMEYGLQPTAFIQVWKEVADAVRAQTNETQMLWSPNINTGKVDDPSQGYTPYWPGETYVDIAGLSFYSSGFNKSINQPPDHQLFTSLFTPFYNLLNPSSFNKSSINLLGLTAPVPTVISETSAQFYYDLTSSSPYYNQSGDTDLQGSLPNITTLTASLASPPFAHSDDELYIKATWFVQMTNNVTSSTFPNLIAISLFNYFKRGGDGNAPVLVDYRAVGGNSTVEAWYRGAIGNLTAYAAGYTGAATSLQSFSDPRLMLVSSACIILSSF